jgi:hypothetical protein
MAQGGVEQWGIETAQGVRHISSFLAKSRKFKTPELTLKIAEMPAFCMCSPP